MTIVCPHCHNSIESEPSGSGEFTCPVCGSNFHLEGGTTTGWAPPEGHRRLGKFELVGEVGSGAFGTVFKARDTELGRVVAVKVPRGGGPGGDRFLREARSVAQLRHPSIVPLYEAGQQDGVPYLVSEFVEGVTLADYLTGGRPSREQAVEWVAAVADALQHAHERGVVHRDVKPSNIMVGEGGTLRVMDFGLAKREAAEATVTVEGQVLGTPAYMSPEQARGESHEVDGRGDVYSLGVVLYQLLTGRLPFQGNPRMMLHRVLHDEPPPPRKLDRAIPRDLETVCLKAMAKEPSRRYATAAEFADDLRRFARGEPVRARRVGAIERGVRWARRRPGAVAAAGLGALLLGAGLWLGQGLWEAQRREEARLLAEEEARQVKVEHYANVVRRWGVPEGIGPVTPEQARRRRITFRFSRRGGRVETVEIIDGNGQLFAESPWLWGGDKLDPLSLQFSQYIACRYEYRRDENNRLTEVVGYDRAGGVVWVFHYTREQVGHFTDERGFPLARAGSGVAYVECVRTEEGFDREVRFLDRHGRRRAGPEGLFGIRQEFDRRGLPVRQTYLGPNDQPKLHMALAQACAHLAAKYNELGDVVEVAFLGLDGKPTMAKLGFASQALSYDVNGNLMELSCYDLEGRLILDNRRPARIRSFYDDRGRQVEWRTYDRDGRLMQGVTAARIVHSYDDRGNMLSWTQFGVDGKTAYPGGVHKCTWRYDERGNLVEEAYFDEGGKPKRNTNAWKLLGEHTPLPPDLMAGVARVTLAYDSRNNPIAFAGYDEAGQPMADRRGVHKTTWGYDGRRNVVDEAHFDTDGKPTAHRRTGIARETRAYDDRGNLTRNAFFGADGKPCTDKDGVARIDQSYDEEGQLDGIKYFGTDGSPVLSKLGYARAEFVYDGEGRHTGSKYLGLAGQPVLTQVLVARFLGRSIDLKTGDVLLSFDGQAVRCGRKFVDDFNNSHLDGSPAELRLSRQGEPRTVVIRNYTFLPFHGLQLETRAVPGGR